MGATQEFKSADGTAVTSSLLMLSLCHLLNSYNYYQTSPSVNVRLIINYISLSKCKSITWELKVWEQTQKINKPNQGWQQRCQKFKSTSNTEYCSPGDHLHLLNILIQLWYKYKWISDTISDQALSAIRTYSSCNQPILHTICIPN